MTAIAADRRALNLISGSVTNHARLHNFKINEKNMLIINDNLASLVGTPFSWVRVPATAPHMTTVKIEDAIP